jgi:tetratricopeptide (TPR) repeat protein
MNRRLAPLVLALCAAAFAAAAGPHAALAAKKPPAPAASAAPATSPAPEASPTATPEPMDVAIPRLEKRLKADPTDKAAMTELSTDYMQINRPDLALPLTQKLLASGTKTAQVYYIDGLAQQQLGHAKESLGDLEQAANLEPTNPGVLGLLTNMYL